jgi:hypothetical protein
MVNYSEFKNIINQENFDKLPSYLNDKDHVQVNINAIANVCNCTAD